MATNNRIDNIGGVWYFPLYDNNGNVTDYVSETGQVVASYAYDAFGRTLSATGPMASVFPFRFSTKYYDAETGLYYYGYRYYSPRQRRNLAPEGAQSHCTSGAIRHVRLVADAVPLESSTFGMASAPSSKSHSTGPKNTARLTPGIMP